MTFVYEQYFADRDIFCAGRVTEEDLQRVAAATGGTVQTTVNNIIDEVSPMHFVTCYYSAWKVYIYTIIRQFGG